MEEVILKAEGLAKDFRGFKAVNNVDLEVRRGSIHALIGPNGAGKTTVFNLLTRFLPVSSGRIIFCGEDITLLKPALVATKGLVRSFQISAVFSRMTLRENVRIALQRTSGQTYYFWRDERSLSTLDRRVDKLLDLVGLSGENPDSPAADLPYGRKRALEFATTLAAAPRMLLLDEPMAGLGGEDIERISALIRGIAPERTVLMVEHNLSVVADLSDRITVLTRGEKLAEGTFAEVSANQAVIDAYMGSVDE
jgi:branched-chain amino acid transport system ATP-binding protein